MGTGHGREGVPGVWDWVGGSGGYTGTHPAPSNDPYSVIFSLKGHTHGQMKAILSYFMRFLEIGSRIDQI